MSVNWSPWSDPSDPELERDEPDELEASLSLSLPLALPEGLPERLLPCDNITRSMHRNETTSNLLGMANHVVNQYNRRSAEIAVK